jgi:hypothetical protein
VTHTPTNQYVIILGKFELENFSEETAKPLQRPTTKPYVKPEAAITVFELPMMGGLSPETCLAIKKYWNNKFYYTFAICWFFL